MSKAHEVKKTCDRALSAMSQGDSEEGMRLLRVDLRIIAEEYKRDLSNHYSEIQKLSERLGF